MSLQTQFTNRFSSLINTYGEVIKVPSSNSDCPNCGYDPVTRKSNGIYNTSNPYAVGSEYNRPFNRGSVCPVCGGTGKITTYTDITALVNWQIDNYRLQDRLGIRNNTVRIKVSRNYYNTIMNSEYVLVPTVNNQYIKCKRIDSPAPFGVGTDNFIKFTCQIVS